MSLDGPGEIVIDLLDAGVLSCPELVRLVAALQAADVAGMTVAMASRDLRLIDMPELTGMPVRSQAACAPRSGGSDRGAECVRGEHSEKRGPDPLGVSPAFAMVRRRSASPSDLSASRVRRFEARDDGPSRTDIHDKEHPTYASDAERLGP